jgi:hypothetical protein
MFQVEISLADDHLKQTAAPVIALSGVTEFNFSGLLSTSVATDPRLQIIALIQNWKMLLGTRRLA